MASSNNEEICISIECVDNQNGNSGVVVYDDKTFPISSQQDATQGTASGAGQSSHSSVRVFQYPYYEAEDTRMERGLPETAGDSHTSLGEEVDDEE